MPKWAVTYAGLVVSTLATELHINVMRLFFQTCRSGGRIRINTQADPSRPLISLHDLSTVGKRLVLLIGKIGDPAGAAEDGGPRISWSRTMQRAGEVGNPVSSSLNESGRRKMDYIDDETGCDLSAQADYFQAVADSQDSGRTVSKLRDRIRELEIEVSEWKHRAIGGTCRILSDPRCDCSLCLRDRKIVELESENAALKTEVELVKAQRDGAADARDYYAEEVERLKLALEQEASADIEIQALVTNIEAENTSLREGLRQIAEHEHCTDGCGPGDGDYQSLTASGHRCAANIAKAALLKEEK